MTIESLLMPYDQYVKTIQKIFGEDARVSFANVLTSERYPYVWFTQNRPKDFANHKVYGELAKYFTVDEILVICEAIINGKEFIRIYYNSENDILEQTPVENHPQITPDIDMPDFIAYENMPITKPIMSVAAHKGREYKDGTAMWSVWVDAIRTAYSKDIITLERFRGTREEAEQRLKDLIT